MIERREEHRFLCSDLVAVQLENQDQILVANLEDISPSGACLEMQQPVPPDATLVLNCSDCRFRGKVRYCAFRQSGYQVGLQFMECKWSKQQYAPKHLLDAPLVPSLTLDDAKVDRLLADLTAFEEARSVTRRPCCDEESCPRADISRLMEPESPLPDRVRIVARAVAWTCEKLGPEDIKQCFSRWFQLPPECMLCDEFVRAYQDEYDALSPKRRAAGGASDVF
jgi:hypothetical protein